MTVNDLYEEAKSIAPWMVEIRRALHRIPENGFQEFKTRAFLIDQLKALSIPYTTIALGSWPRSKAAGPDRR